MIRCFPALRQCANAFRLRTLLTSVCHEVPISNFEIKVYVVVGSRTVRRGVTWTARDAGRWRAGHSRARYSRAGHTRGWSRAARASWSHAVARWRGRAAGGPSCALGYVPPLRYTVSIVAYVVSVAHVASVAHVVPLVT